MDRFRKSIVSASLALSIATALPMAATALDLYSARSTGLAGEVDNGFLAIPPGAPDKAKTLIQSLNNDRRAEYAKIAAQNKITIEEVGSIMAKKILDTLPKGTWIQTAGKWDRK